MPNLLLNDMPYTFTQDSLPCLITYTDKWGGSAYTMSLLTNYFLAGHKILTLTAYPMATENFLEQTKEHEADIALINSVEGNIDMCVSKELLMEKSYKTIIAFT